MSHLRQRSKMIIRKIFGNSSGYLEEVDRISFPSVLHTYDLAFDRSLDEDWIKGKLEMMGLFKSIIEDLELFGKPKINAEFSKSELSNRIFVVHGHDGEMKESVAGTLGKLDLEPIILHEQPNRGRTIIEKFEDFSDINFAVVLLSPDDMGCSKSDYPGAAKPRARQNVIFELGYFIGKLGRKRVAALYRGEGIEIPSDYYGVAYIPYDSFDGWKLKLVEELKECGYDIDKNKL